MVIFRQQVIDAQRQHRLGSIVIQDSSVGRLWFLALTAVATCAVAYLALVEYTRHVDIPATVRSVVGQTVVPAPVMARIAELRVRPGLRVKQGDVLAILDTSAFDVRGQENSRRALLALERRRDTYSNEQHQVAQTAQVRVREALLNRVAKTNEAQSLERQIENQKQRLDVADAQLDRFNDLEKRGFVAKAQVEERRLVVVDAKATLIELNRQRDSALAEAARLAQEAKVAQLELVRQNETIKRSQVALDQENDDISARAGLSVVAPMDGVVASVAIQLGQWVSPQQLLIGITADDSKVELIAYATPEQVGFLREGQAVKLRYSAFAYQKYGLHPGYIKNVSTFTMPGPDGVNELHGQNVYLVTVAVPSSTLFAAGTRQSLQLRSGMTAIASVALEKRKLWEWALDPLLKLWGRA